jgi:hypothetical protein
MMNRLKLLRLTVALAVLGGVAFLAYRHWAAQNENLHDNVLAHMPADASAVIFLDFAELRQAPFFAELISWVPKPQVDPEYLQFVQATGFDYERDLDRVAIAVTKREKQTFFFAVAQGRFDRKKIEAYSSRTGHCAALRDQESCCLSTSEDGRKICFSFLPNGRMAITDDARETELLADTSRTATSPDWRTRFERLAGSPIFAVIRQEAAAGTSLAAQAPLGWQSPQLSSLLDQLPWITVSGKPENDRLRIVVEGESAADAPVRQLTDLLNGLLILAQAGLNDPKTKQQLDPSARDAYLELLNSADVSKIDRGETKSARLMFEITPRFLETVRTARSFAPESPEANPKNPRTPKRARRKTVGGTKK